MVAREKVSLRCRGRRSRIGARRLPRLAAGTLMSAKLGKRQSRANDEGGINSQLTASRSTARTYIFPSFFCHSTTSHRTTMPRYSSSSTRASGPFSTAPSSRGRQWTPSWTFNYPSRCDPCRNESTWRASTVSEGNTVSTLVMLFLIQF